MDSLNQALQQEVISLRSEVQQLKSILIAHKDCPLIVHQTVGGASINKGQSSNIQAYVDVLQVTDQGQRDIQVSCTLTFIELY